LSRNILPARAVTRGTGWRESSAENKEPEGRPARRRRGAPRTPSRDPRLSERRLCAVLRVNRCAPRLSASFSQPVRAILVCAGRHPCLARASAVLAALSGDVLSRRVFQVAPPLRSRQPRRLGRTAKKKAEEKTERWSPGPHRAPIDFARIVVVVVVAEGLEPAVFSISVSWVRAVRNDPYRAPAWEGLSRKDDGRRARKAFKKARRSLEEYCRASAANLNFQIGLRARVEFREIRHERENAGRLSRRLKTRWCQSPWIQRLLSCYGGVYFVVSCAGRECTMKGRRRRRREDWLASGTSQWQCDARCRQRWSPRASLLRPATAAIAGGISEDTPGCRLLTDRARE